MKKDQLLAVLKEARGIVEEAPPKKKKVVKTAGPKKVMTVAEMKQEITNLKAEREDVRQAGDKKRVKIISRRINRLKKMSRKAA